LSFERGLERFGPWPGGREVQVAAASRLRESWARVSVARDVTEQKRSREQLAYRLPMLDDTEDAIIAFDSEWRVTAWNKGAERMYGWSAEDALGRQLRSFMRMELSDEQHAEARREVAERGRWRGEVAVGRKDGSRVSLESITVAISDQHSQVTGYLSIHRDVTERTPAEPALLEAQRRSKAILESISDSFSSLDAEWRFVYVNRRALDRVEEVKGKPVALDELVDKNIWEVFPEMVGTTIDHELHRAVREQKTLRFEAYSPPTGVWLELHAYPSEDGGVSVYGHDITERKRAEEERESRARQQALVAELGLRALASDELQPLLDGAVALVARMLNVELVGVAEVLPGGERLLLRAGVGWTGGAVEGGTAMAGPGSLIDYTIASGDPMVSEDLAADDRFALSPLLSENGAVSGATVVIGGRSEPFGSLGAFSSRRRSFSKHDVNFLQAVANVLATAVERTQAMERLEEVREAERSRIARDLHDEALQDLAVAVAQTMILVGAPVLDSATRRRVAGVVSALRSASQHLRAAIYDLRLTGEEHRPVVELLADLVELQRALAVNCQIDLEIREGAPTGPLGPRGTELLRLVREALVNARRHSRARTIRVVVSGSRKVLCISVTDDGRGIDAARDPSVAAGWGIAGMRERAALLGGELEIKSEPTAGTSVRLTLPLASHDEATDVDVRVLVVEDHPAMREAIATRFEREPGFVVAGQAGALAEARPMLTEVDFAVVDLGLPDGDGGDLINELRDRNPRARALVLTASLDPADNARAERSGAAAVLNKTADLDDLVDAVRRLHHGAAPRL
jgi:PAS domain S-box-containing protein